jgi:phosphoglycolate phosphatase-like HAD superfamily hydrolase
MAHDGHVPNAPDRPLAVFDVDGVLADVRHRLHHLDARPKRWDAFFAAATEDPLLEQGAALLHEAARECEVLYLTGRPERCRADTLAWFARHGLPEGALTMRSDRDRAPARVGKPRWLRRAARGRTVAVVVDDDLAVCEAYEEAGYRVLRADWMTGDGAPTLQEAQEGEGRT